MHTHTASTQLHLISISIQLEGKFRYAAFRFMFFILFIYFFQLVRSDSLQFQSTIKSILFQYLIHIFRNKIKSSRIESSERAKIYFPTKFLLFDGYFILKKKHNMCKSRHHIASSHRVVGIFTYLFCFYLIPLNQHSFSFFFSFGINTVRDLFKVQTRQNQESRGSLKF